MNRARGSFVVRHCWRVITVVVCLVLAAIASDAQQRGVDRSAYSFSDGPVLGGSTTQPISSAQLIPLHSEEPDASSSGLPESPKKAQPGLPAFDSLRLMSSTSRDEDLDPELPVSASRARVSFDGAAISAVQRSVRFSSKKNKALSDDAAELARELEEPWRYESYHWRGLIAQSLFFNAVESTFRIASDDQIRRLVARKPYWHDYFASMRQFNMGRWNDGDDFLTNYVGHPLHGAVAGFIEIQNDPTGRQQEISATHDYWTSRFKGFLWATAFSTYSEIGPSGEAGIGNEGGWTYPLGPCHRPCKEYNPQTWKYTNNTGWVDFIITPVVGTLWMLAEDTVDRYISDRVQGDRRSAAFPLILRGALNPARTMANAMRFKLPWYRDFQHGLPSSYDLAPLRRQNFGIHMLPGDDETQAPMRRFSLSAHYRAMPLGSLNSPCGICIASNGGGIEADYAITRWISASMSLDRQAGLLTPKKLAMSEASGAPDATGSTIIAGFGVRLMHDRPHNMFSFAIRPGFLVDQVQVPGHVNTLRGSYQEPLEFSITHTAASLLLSNDYKINRRFAIRSSFGATIVRYRTPERDPDGVGEPPYITFLSKENFTNHTTWTWQGGPVFHF